MMDFTLDRFVCQPLWNDAMGDELGYTEEYENDTFKVVPYSWCDDSPNDCHFWHKPSGFKMAWYKYPLRGVACNMEITSHQFLDILHDCRNSMQEKYPCKVLVECTKWWEDFPVSGKTANERIMELARMVVSKEEDLFESNTNNKCPYVLEQRPISCDMDCEYCTDEYFENMYKALIDHYQFEEVK